MIAKLRAAAAVAGLCATAPAVAQDVIPLKPGQHEVFGWARKRGPGYLVMDTREKMGLRIYDAKAEQAGRVNGFALEDMGFCANCLRVVGVYRADGSMDAASVYHAPAGGIANWPEDR